MSTHTPGSIFASLAGILVSGIAGGFAGWSVIRLLDWDGVGGAMTAAVIGMGVATAVWIGITAALRALGLLR